MKDKKRRAFKVEGDTLYLAKPRSYHPSVKNCRDDLDIRRGQVGPGRKLSGIRAVAYQKRMMLPVITAAAMETCQFART